MEHDPTAPRTHPAAESRQDTLERRRHAAWEAEKIIFEAGSALKIDDLEHAAQLLRRASDIVRVGYVDRDTIHPAGLSDVQFALAFALQHNGRRRFHQGDDFQATITADHLIQQLTQNGFVVMRKPVEHSDPTAVNTALSEGQRTAEARIFKKQE